MSNFVKRLGEFPGAGQKAPVKTVTDAPITLVGTQTVNGVPVTTGDRVLVKDQVNAAENGIWTVALDNWKRSTDFNERLDAVSGTKVLNAANGNEYYVSFTGIFDPGTTLLTWAPTVAASLPWGGLTGTLADQTDLQAALDGKAALSHSHIIGDVTGLQAALDLKAPLATPTFTGPAQVDGNFIISGGQQTNDNDTFPRTAWIRNNSGVDQKRWEVGVSATGFLIRHVNDANSVGENFLSATASGVGATVDSVSISTNNNTALSINNAQAITVSVGPLTMPSGTNFQFGDGNTYITGNAGSDTIDLVPNGTSRFQLSDTLADFINVPIEAGSASSTSGATVIQGIYTATDNTLVLGSLRSSGATALCHNVRPDPATNDGFESCNALASNQQAFWFDGGGFKFGTATVATPVNGTDIALSNVLTITASGGINAIGNAFNFGDALNNVYLDVEAGSASAGGLRMYQSTTLRAYVEYSTANGVTIDSDGGMRLQTNNTLAINIDAQQTVRFYGQSYFSRVNLSTAAASIAWNLDTAQVAQAVLGASGPYTLANPTNKQNGGTYILYVVQDATGSRTMAFGTDYKFPGGTAPTFSTGANAVDILTFVSDGVFMYGVANLNFS